MLTDTLHRWRTDGIEETLIRTKNSQLIQRKYSSYGCVENFRLIDQLLTFRMIQMIDGEMIGRP
jgi:hypothetical protein